jgi:hypothetical protein
METDHHTNRNPDMVHRDEMTSGVRWTLGNLDQAFDQAFDEAFRTCTHLFNEFERCAGKCEEECDVESHRPIVARFRSCEGPISDSGS